MMQVSCTTRWADGLPFEQAMACIHEAGFVQADVVVADASALAAIPLAIRPGLPRIGGLHLLDSGTPEQIRNGIRLAGELGLRSLAISAGPRRQESMQYFVQTLELVLAGLPGDMRIELVNRNGTRLEQLEDFRELFVLLGSRRVSVAIDSVEFHLASVNPCNAIREWGDRMSRLSVGDMVGDRRLPLGEGEVNVRAVIEHARRIGYNGPLVLDPFVSDPTSPHDDLVCEHVRLRVMLEG